MKTPFGWTLEGPYAHAQSLSYYRDSADPDYYIDLLLDGNGDTDEDAECTYQWLREDLLMVFVPYEGKTIPYLITLLPVPPTEEELK